MASLKQSWLDGSPPSKVKKTFARSFMFEETIRAKDREVFHEDSTYQHLHAHPESLHLPKPEEFLAQQIFTNPSMQAVNIALPLPLNT
ncbi:hypothetical protein CROQUDRAFT_661442 [Cronartium quercuum f. sp. fusiforme G11]|uniref:Uncharacterized protein n=1 Tax=Cronartium quercuum f. sp. fusiforme G11 TaxID=708437 RepID=A0A9P6NFQ1_9BASI|nr:hypothetical protein CROQUDRAFT_661442 [Cronartium quercuum f. sp. fusiforme G11]